MPLISEQDFEFFQFFRPSSSVWKYQFPSLVPLFLVQFLCHYLGKPCIYWANSKKYFDHIQRMEISFFLHDNFFIWRESCSDGWCILLIAYLPKLVVLLVHFVVFACLANNPWVPHFWIMVKVVHAFGFQGWCAKMKPLEQIFPLSFRHS